MTETPYNPQEVLCPLMFRLGRLLPGDREGGFERMAEVIREELHVDPDDARHMVLHLAHARLIVYEEPVPARSHEVYAPGGQPLSGHHVDAEIDAAEGAWRIGPTE